MERRERYLLQQYTLLHHILLRPIPTPVLSGSGSKGPSEDVSGLRLPLGKSRTSYVEDQVVAILLKWPGNSTRQFKCSV